MLVDDHRHLWHDRGRQTNHRSQEEPTVARHIIAAFVVIDMLMERLGHRSDRRARVPNSEILTLAVVAAGYVGRHHERAAPHRRGRRC
mgnify:CR=1 FL=1